MSITQSLLFNYILYRTLLDNAVDPLSTSDINSLFVRNQHPIPDYDPITSNSDQIVCQKGYDSSNFIQFFVRLISEGKTLVMHGKPHDKVYTVHEKIQIITGIPIREQRLVYGHKQLQHEQTLSECMISNDSGLQLVGRLRSCWHPESWRLIDDLMFTIYKFCEGEKLSFYAYLVKRKLTNFVELVPKNDVEVAKSFFNVLVSCRVPKALMIMYKCSHDGSKVLVFNIVQSFVTAIRFKLPQPISSSCIPVVLELCKLFRTSAGKDDDVYKLCRSHLVPMVKQSHGFGRASNIDIPPFIFNVTSNISKDLVLSMESRYNSGPSKNDIDDFVAFLEPLKAAVKVEMTSRVAISGTCKLSRMMISLGVLFDLLLTLMVMCLDTMEDSVMKNEAHGGWSQYLFILKELNDISKFFEGAEKDFWTRLRYNKVSLCHLIVTYASRGGNYEWILEHKELTNSESRRHLVRLLLPVIDDDNDDFEMLIDRSELLVQSFEYIAHAEPEYLCAELNIEFNDEEAMGPGVVREWFLLVCREIFSSKSSLFIACPSDRKRFFPNRGNCMQLEYYNFAGRAIALALMHNVHVGIAFDRSFILQLAGVNVSLEDIKDADPTFYNSCKKILDMDPMDVDRDVLCLTFDEFIPGGTNVSVNSGNRKEYIDHLIHDRFTKSVSEQITRFAKGFTDIVGEERIQKIFFKSLDVEDFDGMLYGSETGICVEDWKAHTVYKTYHETDPQIRWFWEIVGGMTAKQRKALLFFWTSIEYLPANGFVGLDSKLSVHKSSESMDRQPTSHTCFYRLCLPAYSSKALMQSRLDFITQDHVAYSFGSV